jgi:hypothetical protein
MSKAVASVRLLMTPLLPSMALDVGLVIVRQINLFHGFELLAWLPVIYHAFVTSGASPEEQAHEVVAQLLRTVPLALVTCLTDESVSTSGIQRNRLPS